MEENNFKSVSVGRPRKPSFFKAILLPFISGIIGAGLVIGICFGIPTIKNDIFNRKYQPRSI